MNNIIERLEIEIDLYIHSMYNINPVGVYFC